MPQNDRTVPRHLKAPESVDISITGGCNLSCRYCFYADPMARLKDLSTDDWKRVFRELGNARVMRVTITGGEPFYRPDFFELVDSVVENRMRYSILTNGTLIDERTIEAFSIGKRRLRLESIQVSIDGSCAEVHNKSRPGSFDRAVKALRLLLKSGFPVTVRATISRHNMHDLEAMSEFLLEDIGLPSMTNNEASPIGTGCICSEEIALDHVDTLRVGLRLEQLQLKYPGRITAQAGPLAKLRMYREMEDARQTGRLTNRWQMGSLSSCGGVFSKMGILHDGSIVPCSMLHDLFMGNILTDDLLDLWKNSTAIRNVRERYGISLRELAECSGCPWTDFCNGGCPGVTQQMRKTIIAPGVSGCYRSFLEANGIESLSVVKYTGKNE